MEEENNNILPKKGTGEAVFDPDSGAEAILAPAADLPKGAEGREEGGVDLLSQLQKEKEALQAEVEALRAAEAVYREKEAKQAQWEELHALYPDLDPRTLPREVAEDRTSFGRRLCPLLPSASTFPGSGAGGERTKCADCPRGCPPRRRNGCRLHL